MNKNISKDVEMITDFGTVILRLSDKTPKHRDNFIKLVNEKFYDSILFHRVIENFLIQTGDHQTKPSSLKDKIDAIDLPKPVAAEFNASLFHKRGALNAAREGDFANLSRASHGSQFTIIQGKIQTDSTLNSSLRRINYWRAQNNVINRAQFKQDFEKYALLSHKIDKINDFDTIFSVEEQKVIRKNFNDLKVKIAAYKIDSLSNLALGKLDKYEYPKAHKNIYKSIGGAPHLDQNYTVFGHVVKGMHIVDSIAAVPTEKSKPIKEVYIISIRMIDRKKHYE